MTIECKCPICKGKKHWDPPRPPNPLHVGSWRYQDVPLTNEQVEVAQWVNGVGWMIPDTRLQAIANAYRKNQEGYLRMLLGDLAKENKPSEPICSCDELGISLCVLHWKNDPALTEKNNNVS